MSNTMSIYAQALLHNKKFAKNVINAKNLGFSEYCTWKKALVDALHASYKVAEYRYNNMGKGGEVQSFDLSDLYASIRPIVRMIGEVNGDTLNPVNVAEIFVAKSLGKRKISTSEEHAHAVCNKDTARKALNNAEQGTMSDKDFAARIARLQKNFDDADAEVKRLEDMPGHCKFIATIVSEGAFVNAIQEALGDAIDGQMARPMADILAEKEAKAQNRKDKRRANKNAKKEAENNTAK